MAYIRMSKSSAQGQNHKSKKTCLNIMFAGGVPLKGNIVVNNDVGIVGNFRNLN